MVEIIIKEESKIIKILSTDIPDGFFVGRIGNMAETTLFLKMDRKIFSLDDTQYFLGSDSGNYWSGTVVFDYKLVKKIVVNV